MEPAVDCDAAVEPDSLDELPDISPQTKITVVHKFSVKKRILSDPFAASFARKITVTTSTFFLAKYFQCCRDRTRYVAIRAAANLICNRMLTLSLWFEMNRKRAACIIQTLFRKTQLRLRLKSSVSTSLEVLALEACIPRLQISLSSLQLGEARMTIAEILNDVISNALKESQRYRTSSPPHECPPNRQYTWDSILGVTTSQVQ